MHPSKNFMSDIMPKSNLIYISSEFSQRIFMFLMMHKFYEARKGEMVGLFKLAN
jgi:hypothetical protein